MKNVFSLKEINRIAIPALFAGIAEPLLSMADTAFVGHLPNLATESLAAVGLVGVFLSMLIWILGQTRSAISTIVSQYLGAEKLNEIANLPAQAIYSVLVLSLIIIGFTYPFADAIFKLYNADHLLLKLSVDYYKIRVFGLPFTLFTFAVFGTFRGLQNTFYPMIIAITGALLNIILDYVLIFGYNNLIPAMGIKGAAVASVMAQFVMALLAFIFLYIKTPFRLRLSLPFNPEMKNLVLMIANLFIRTIALNVALYYGSAYATKYGDTSIAAYTISIQIWFFFAFVLDGYSSAGNILSGKLFGGKRYVDLEILGKKLMKYGMVTGIVLGLISAIFYKDIGHVFIKDSDVLKQFYSVFWIVLAMQPINGIAFVFDGVFKGLGYMSYLRNVLLLATFIGFIPTLFLFDYFNFNLYAIWIAFTVWMLIRAGTLWYKFTHLSVFKNENIVT